MGVIEFVCVMYTNAVVACLGKEHTHFSPSGLLVQDTSQVTVHDIQVTCPCELPIEKRISILLSSSFTSLSSKFTVISIFELGTP